MHVSAAENLIKQLFLHVLFYLYFAVRETVAALIGATFQCNTGDNNAAGRRYSCFESVQSRATHWPIFVA
jgi:hypothetical protein